MSGAASLIAIMAAQHARRLQEVTDAFRLADATAADRARTLEALGVARHAEVEELAKAGVLRPGRRDGTWWLSESAVVARRDAARRPHKGLLAAIVVLLAVMLAGIALLRRP